MQNAIRSRYTRVWWDGGEVEFVRWTDQALVFQWTNAKETAIHMPRGAVVRLLEKGVLTIEGDAPEWISPLEPDKPSESQKSAKMNMIARLIRKLAGSDDSH